MHRTILACLAVFMSLPARTALAQTYTISWWTVDAGGLNGATAGGGTFELSGTAGQPDAGGPFVGGPVTIHSGFWGLAAGGGGGPQADVAVTITDGQLTAVPGTPITYTMTVTNAGPSAASGVEVFAPDPSLLGPTYTCVATSGSTCPASGTGGPNHFVSVAAGGTLTYTVTGTIQTSVFGLLVYNVTATPPPGLTDPNLANNSAADPDTLTPHADLGLSVSDGPDPVGPQQRYSYTLDITNAGPSYSWGGTLTVPLPAGVAYTDAIAFPGSCTQSAGTVTCDLAGADVSETRTLIIAATLAPGTGGTLSMAATVLGDDPDPATANNVDIETTTVGQRAHAELAHGTRLTADLQSAPFAPDPDVYRLRQEPHTSYEVVLDGGSGDIGEPGGPWLELMAADGISVIAAAGPVGAGPSRSLRWINDTTSVVDDQVVRVRSNDCLLFCGPEDQYRLRMWDTTGSIPRFNNSGTQATIIVLHNAGSSVAQVRLFFRDAAGVLRFEYPVVLQAKQLLVMNTAGFNELAGLGGSVTVASDAPFGTLVGKAVALEPGTGFSFDSPMTLRPR